MVAITLAMPAVTQAQLTPANTGLSGAARGTGLSSSCAGTECITTVIANVISIILGFLGVVLLLIFIYAGFKWMTAEKDDDVKNAKSMIKNAVIGLVIISLSYTFASFVLDQLVNISNGGAPDSAPAPAVDPGATGEPKG